MPKSLVMILLISAAVSSQAEAARRRPLDRSLWSRPSCETTGGAEVLISTDSGRSLLPSTTILSQTGYTYGVVTLRSPNRLVAVHNSTVLSSSDAGCSWITLGSLAPETFPPFLVAALDDSVYAWSPSRDSLYRITASSIEKLVSPVPAIAGLGVDAKDAARLRIAGDNGAIYESDDRGASWVFRGALRTEPSFLYVITFDPSNLDHAIAGGLASGGWYTFDGGLTWERSSGLSMSERPNVNVFKAVISPVDSNVVWVMGIDMALETAPSRGRQIYRSTDGGRSFRAVIEESASVKLINGPTMAPHPTDASVLYFVFGTYFQSYGTDVWMYDADGAQLTASHHDVDDINSIAFHPADPRIVYFGIENEQISIKGDEGAAFGRPTSPREERGEEILRRPQSP